MSLENDQHYANLHQPLQVDNYVPGEGPLNGKIAFVGEAPGMNERRLRRPFVGASGQDFDKYLLSAGIHRADCYITNTIKEQPNGNDITPFIDLSKRIPLEGPLWNHYLEILRQELANTNSNLLVAVGAVPLWALCRRKGITKYRGSILESTLLPGRKVIPIIHPAAAMREFLFTHIIRWDMKRIKRESEFPEIRRVQRNLLLNPSLMEVQAFLSALRQSINCLGSTRPYVEVDIEILNEEISCISVGNEKVGTMSIPFVSEAGDYFTPEEESLVWMELAKIFENPAVHKLGQNITFDATFIFRRYGIRCFPVLDTMVAQGIAFPDLPKGLDFTTSMYTDEPYYKDDGKKWFKLGGSFRDLWLYNAKDSAVLPEIHSKQLAELNKQSNAHAYAQQLRLIEPLVYLGERGIKCDSEGLKLASSEASEEILRLTTKLHELCGYELNPSSPKQLADYFYGKKGFKPYVNRKTGGVSTDRDALKRLSRKGSEEATVLLKIRKLSKLKGTYLDIRLDADSRLRCSFNPVGTSSGRLSSSQTIFGTGGNMQNLPLDFKKFLHFDTNYIGYNVDLSQAENRTVAYVAPDELMIRAFEDGLDVHSLTGSLISGLPIDQVREEDEKNICCEIGGGIYTWRFWGKKANHGLNYDLGYRTFAFYYEIPERDAQFIVEKYHRAYPGVRQYHSWIRATLAQGRTLQNCLGRRRLFLGRWGDELFKEAYSFIPQSTIADKLNHFGLLPLYYEERFREVDLLNQVHDSLVFQIPTSIPPQRHAEILFALKESLEKPLTWDGREFVIPADIEFSSVGGNMGKVGKDSEGNITNPTGLKKFKGKTMAELRDAIEKVISEAPNETNP